MSNTPALASATRKLVRIVITCACASAFTGWTPSRRLEIVARDRVLWSAAASEGQRFDLRFEHSQERTPFIQHYRVGAAGVIEQDSVSFGSYGAGMPLEPVVLDGHLLTAQVRRRLRSVRMLSSRPAHVRIVFRGVEVAIDQWLDDYEPFELRLR